MRPVRKGTPYLYQNGQDFHKAKDGLIARLGQYCIYCERKLLTGLEVEHIQPKSIPANALLEKQWSNLLLSCKNCNTCKDVKNIPLTDWLIPDRDNTFAAFQYLEDGQVISLPGPVFVLAQQTIGIVNLNREIPVVHDEHDILMALDKRTQRMNEWIQAKRWRKKWDLCSTQDNEDAVLELALATGFFSIWMAAFDGVPNIRKRLIAEFIGTEAACFDPATTKPVSPHPNTDGLIAGGKL